MIRRVFKYCHEKISFGETKHSSFFISLVELDKFNKIKLSKIGRLDWGLNPGCLHNNHYTKVSSVLV